MIAIVILVHATRARPDLDAEPTRSPTSGAGRSQLLPTLHTNNIKHHLVSLGLPVCLLSLYLVRAILYPRC